MFHDIKQALLLGSKREQKMRTVNMNIPYRDPVIEVVGICMTQSTLPLPSKR